MLSRIAGLALAALLCPCWAAAAVVDVTTELDADTLQPGQRTTLRVYAEVRDGMADAGNGIFGWDVSLRSSDPLVAGVLSATLDRTGWTGHPRTSSPGAPRDWGLAAIYDTSETRDDMGLSTTVLLFTVDVQALTLGTTTFLVEPDFATGADFLTWSMEAGGDYSAAAVRLNVVPSPPVLLLLAAIAPVALPHRRHRLHRTRPTT